MDDDRDGTRIVHGRVEPDDSSFSYQVHQGVLVPVVWNLGSVFCGHCQDFKSLSLQAIHKHLKSRHQQATKNHDMKVLRKCVFEPADADGVSGIIIHEKKIADNARTGCSDAEATACSNGEADEASSGSSDEQSSTGCTDDEAKDSSGSCDEEGAGSKDGDECKGCTDENASDSGIKEGAIEPDNACFSYQIDRGAMVPVLWHVGPAFCAYCPDFKSISLQAVYKHINTKHRKESDAHAHKVLRKTLREPVDQEGICATINHQKTNALTIETKASDQGQETKKKRKRVREVV